jgi:glyoxylase-like metal-dependent hydrolase (beta-lactamase superfamily II)
MSGELHYPWAEHPAHGTTREVVPGVRWLTMPMGGSLTHINLYLIEDVDGWYVVDTGLANAETSGLWQRIIDSDLGGRPVKGVVCTHMHPDHTGCAGFLTEKFRVPLLMTRAEYYQARAMFGGHRRMSSWIVQEFYARAGMSPRVLERTQHGPPRMSSSGGGERSRYDMPELPVGFHRLQDGDVLNIGGNDWHVVVGAGHSPEHACLHCRNLGVLLSGDQILPVITSNVSVHPTEPDANPLKSWLESHDRFLDKIPASTLVLPAHNLPFRGVRERLRRLIEHHEDRMLAIEEACEHEARVAKDFLPVLFRRRLDERQVMMALGEAIAHVHLLLHRDRLERTLGDDGAWRYRATDPTLERRRRPHAHDAPDEQPMMV